MRKYLFAALVLLLVAVPGQWAAAQELGGPVSLTPKGQFSLVFSGSYVFEQNLRDYDFSYNDSDGYSDTMKRSGKFKNDQYYLLCLNYGLTDWANIFAQFGVVTGGRWVDCSRGYTNEWEATLDTQFVWALGGRARVLSLDSGFNFDVAARYLRYDNRTVKDWVQTTSGYVGNDGYNFDDQIDYWQVDVDVTVSRTWGMFTPYVGVGYSYGEADYSSRWTYKDGPGYEDYSGTMKSDQEFAALCGMDISLGRDLSLYLQGVFVARTAVTLGLAWFF